MNTQTITIEKQSFTAPAPYSEGHVLLPNEAAALNQTFAENLRNNFAKRVKAALASDATAEVVDAASQASFDAYAAEYSFGVRRAGSGDSTPRDPILRAAYEIARQKIREMAKQKGKKLSAEQVNTLVPQLLESQKNKGNETIMDEARRQVEAEKTISIEDLGVDLPDNVDEMPVGMPEASAGESEAAPAEGEPAQRKRKRG